MKSDKTLFEIIQVSDSSEYFEKFMGSLKENITTWDYFVNWDKVFNNISHVEMELNILNYLIGKPENVIKVELISLVKKYPEVIKTIPILLASRDKATNMLTSYNTREFVYKNYVFAPRKSLTSEDYENIAEFADKSGLLKLFTDKKIKNIVDYVLGVEVGLDSNGRKNRTGNMMEAIVELFVSETCEKYKCEYISQATAVKVKEKWGLNITVDKSSRIIDFIIYKAQKLLLIETNFYAGGGSKLKSTAGEYKTMFDYWKNDGHNFLWITDGYGWKSTKLPLQEAFQHLDYIFNLEFLINGMLGKIVERLDK